MAVKNIQIPPKKGQNKPLVICEFEEKEAPTTTGHFIAGEAELKKVADKMAKSLTKNKMS
ncbi:hypothetical protein [Marinibactrum halimedae]|uniref:Uncharacterized protein n=1 Tax=Marinibactrum halimedae TaxID=1444977 RepID=A0AA37WNR8_9GAMM|nr:hypothetical protein [Marinibactrum halimedae]MCD9460612.1 hypothetical protein [Marinibactrum halimedae]GLS27828.1 hypothetical protein GCM10007877_35470 [Marinibactrum halimedae]